ncbi:LOW QUALITY PROTEIN: hypothetical protein Cgig2_031606 [Carnegiea gigantea]|uniref:Uncharacterized protein n=1 Tax=Carnegiea gigantea TaxID=171969 RepID=A0A9Q1K074_9CARY|nr:LOW QUALITY PROTEIN: hypothetical protein Cgig2_031606 [Carnegiea gigantea]
MIDTIMQQVIEQVKEAIEATSSTRPLPYFDYMPATGCKPSHRHVPVASLHWGGPPIETSPEPRTTGKVNHGFNTVYDSFLAYCLVQGIGANLKASGGSFSAEEATADDFGTETAQYAEILEGRSSFERNASPRGLTLKKKMLRRDSGHHRQVIRGRIGSEPHRDHPPPTMLREQEQGKECRGGLLGSGSPHGIQGHPGTAQFAQGTNTNEGPVGRPQKEQKVNKYPYTLNVRVLIIIVVLMCHGLIAFIITGCGLPVQRRSLLVSQTAFISHRRVEIHQLWIPTLRLRLMMILYVFDIRLKIVLLHGGQGRQEFTKELCAVFVSLSIALMLGFGRLLSPRRSLGLCPRIGFFQLELEPPRPLSLSSPSPNGVCIWSLHLSIFGTPSGGQEFASSGLKQTELNPRPLALEQRPGKKYSTGLVEEKIAARKKEVEKRFGFTSAMATCSLVTFDGSAELKRARAQDLVNPSTKAYLAERSTAKKSTGWTWGHKINLLHLGLDTLAPFTFGHDFLLRGLSTLEGRKHFPRLLCRRQKKVRTNEKPRRKEMLRTLRIILKYKEASREKEQFRKPIERLPIARLAPLVLRLLPYVHNLAHKRLDCLRTIVVLKIASDLGPTPGWLPEWATNWVPIIPIGKISPIRLSMNEKDVILLGFYFRLLFNDHHVTLFIVKTILLNVHGLAGSPLNYTSFLILRMLGVREYSQLDHEGMPGSFIGTEVRGVPMQSEEVEDVVEGEVEDIHNPFEDSKKCEDATVSLKEDKGGSRASFSREPVSLSKRNLKAC